MFGRRAGDSRYNRRGIGAKSGGAAVTPANFGTSVGWIDPRTNITHTGDLTAVTDWNDSGLGAHDGTVVGAPTYEATGWNGLPSVLFDGTDDGVHFPTIGALFTGSDIPLYVVTAMQLITVASPKTPLALGNTANASHTHRIFLDTSTNWGIQRNDAATNKFYGGAVSSADTSRHVMTWQFTGTLGTLLEDGASVNLDGRDLDVGTIPFNAFSIGFWRASTNKDFANVRFGPVLVYTSLTDAAGARQWLIDEGYGP